MTAPNIIGVAADGDTRTYNPTANTGATREFTGISIPANANTVFLMFTVDSPETSRTISSFTFDNATLEGTLLQNVDVSASTNAKVTAVRAYDTRSLGALTSQTVDVTLTSGTSVAGFLGVVCTDGFLESFSSSNNLSGTTIQNVCFSGNSNNTTLLHMASIDGNVSGFSYTTGTEVYKQASSNSSLSLVCAKQTTNSATGAKTIVADKGNTEEVSSVSILISSQSDPFDGVTGSLTSPIVK